MNASIGRLLLLVLCVIVFLAGCGKKTAKEFYPAKGRYDVLVAREGDDAWLTDEMDALSKVFAAIPPRAIESPQAQALVETIAKERARVTAERAEAARAAAEQPAPEAPVFDAPAAAETVQPATPAAPGAAEEDDSPQGGMPLADFRSKYASCVVDKGLIEVNGAKSPGFAVSDSPACLKQLKAPAGTTFFFTNERLAGRVVTSVTRTTVILDAGTTTQTTTETVAPRYPGAPAPGSAPQGPPQTINTAPTGEGMKTVETGQTLTPRTTQ